MKPSDILLHRGREIIDPLPIDAVLAMLFLSIPKVPKRRDSLLMVSSLFREGGPKVRVGVTQVETQDRLHFGPFSLSVPEDLPAF